MHSLYVEGFDDNVITEMINMLCNVFFFLGLRSIISWVMYHPFWV